MQKLFESWIDQLIDYVTWRSYFNVLTFLRCAKNDFKQSTKRCNNLTTFAKLASSKPRFVSNLCQSIERSIIGIFQGPCMSLSFSSCTVERKILHALRLWCERKANGRYSKCSVHSYWQREEDSFSQNHTFQNVSRRHTRSKACD